MYKEFPDPGLTVGNGHYNVSTHVYVVIKTGQNSQNEISPMRAGGEKGKNFLQAKCSR